LQSAIEEPGTTVVALVGATIAATLTAIVVWVLSWPIGPLLQRMHPTTDEGAAWSGISIGLPFAGVGAIIAFVYFFKKIFNYGSSSK
jgi:hypothetical protein